MTDRQGPISGPVLHRSRDAAQLATAVAQAVADALHDALTLRPRATLVVSGGRTPVAMWQRLSQMALAWQRVDITLADERWVPPEHPDSNEALVRVHLLQHQAAAAHWLGLYISETGSGMHSPEAACPEIEQRLSSMLAWPFDVVVLGMGVDGHTASWFPGQQLPTDDRLCFATPAPPAPNVVQPRISLSPKALLSARHVLVQIQGQDKEAMLAKALLPPLGLEHEQTECLALPIRRVLWGCDTPCHVHYAP